MLEKTANALLFQAGWFACVMGGDSAWLIFALTVLVIHWYWHGEGRLLLEAFAFGVALDSGLMWLHVYDFHPNGVLIPLWLALLWPLLAMTLRHCLAGRGGWQQGLELLQGRCLTPQAGGWRGWGFPMERCRPWWDWQGFGPWCLF